MKLRQGFVSNSSSSSFVIWKKHLMPIQIQSIHDNEEIAESLGMLWPGGWYIREVGDQIKGSTLMDNFDMHEFLIDKLGIPKEYISWGE